MALTYFLLFWCKDEGNWPKGIFENQTNNSEEEQSDRSLENMCTMNEKPMFVIGIDKGIIKHSLQCDVCYVNLI